MIIKEKTQRIEEVEEAVLIECDICHKRYDLKSSNIEDVIESQEFINIYFTGGYGSVFGDEETLELNMCQNCFKEKLGEYVRTVN